jgi:hypothetical protein
VPLAGDFTSKSLRQSGPIAPGPAVPALAVRERAVRVTGPGGVGYGLVPEERMAEEDLKAELERLRAENERLKQRPARATGLKVSEKGGVSVYGLGRFPVTLYKEQWLKLLDMSDEIRAFIKENESKLKTKED